MEGPVDTPQFYSLFPLRCSEEGLFKAELIFPIDFPNKPPTMRFISQMWHPNSSSVGLPSYVVFANGCVCISILHPPGTDDLDIQVEFAFGSYWQEREDEQWRPIISVEAILLSVQNMLTDPNENSPANLDAAVLSIGLA